MPKTISKKDSSVDDAIPLSEAFTELEKLVEEFEEGDIDLEKGIPKFRRGLSLAAMLKRRLQEIENEIEEIKAEFKEEV